MSEYFQGLGDEEKARYKAKLAKVGMFIGDGPNLSDESFSSDYGVMACCGVWPHIQLSDNLSRSIYP